MANDVPWDERFVAGISAGPYILGKFGGIAFRMVLEGLHVIVVSCFKLRFAEAWVIFDHSITVYGGFVDDIHLLSTAGHGAQHHFAVAQWQLRLSCFLR